MTEATASPGTTSRFMPSFHFWLTCAMCGFVFAGFGMTYLFPLTAVSFAPAPPIVHLHALIFFSWMLLLLTQSAMLPVLPPGVNRFWANLLGLSDAIPTFWLYLTLWSFAAALLIQERRSTGKIGVYSMFGAGWILLQGALHELVVGSETFNAFAAGLLGLVHYR